ncbi:MAG: hypothetical protein WD267_06335 [Balneolales bacterium]
MQHTDTQKDVLNNPSEIEATRDQLRLAKSQGRTSLLKIFIKLSGPGWMQSALTLGGGSLAASLYLGILGGTGFLWLQPLAVIMGIIMLSAVSYVILSTGKNPYDLLNQHLGPIIAWGWLLSAGISCVVWAFPQFSLATAVIQENMLPTIFGSEGNLSPGLSQLIICVIMALIAISLVWAYDAGIRSAKLFDYFLKALICMMFLAFFGVLIRVAMEGDGIVWGDVLAGMIPNFTLLTSPAETLMPYIDSVEAGQREFWINLIASEQRDLIITTAAVVVGVNSTVLLSYSMIKKGWDRNFRGLAIFDLSLGFFIPFVLITGCMVVVSASLFHTEPVSGLLDDDIAATPRLVERFEDLKRNRVIAELESEGVAFTDSEISNGMDNLDEADQQLAAMLVHRDAFDLSQTLKPLTGDMFSHIIFGFGVLGLAISTIIIQMVTWGFVTCEILKKPKHGWPYRLGSLPPALGILAPFIWTGKAQFWLVVPTSLFVAVLLPIAYLSFSILMNNEKIMGDDMPRGFKRVTWNTLMGLATLFAFIGSIWSMWSRIGGWSIIIIILFILIVIGFNLIRGKSKGLTS